MAVVVMPVDVSGIALPVQGKGIAIACTRLSVDVLEAPSRALAVAVLQVGSVERDVLAAVGTDGERYVRCLELQVLVGEQLDAPGRLVSARDIEGPGTDLQRNALVGDRRPAVRLQRQPNRPGRPSRTVASRLDGPSASGLVRVFDRPRWVVETGGDMWVATGVQRNRRSVP